MRRDQNDRVSLSGSSSSAKGRLFLSLPTSSIGGQIASGRALLEGKDLANLIEEKLRGLHDHRIGCRAA